jgi:DNA-binding NarL/FixJ family response regulator
LSEIKVLVADDHPIVREGLVALLGSLDGFTVVATAADGQAAVREAVQAKPDVAVIDLQMPVLDGIAATREITRVAPGVAVLVLTMHDEDEAVLDAMRAGARGYLVKGAEQDEIARAIRAVAAGGAIFGPAVASRVLSLVLQGPRQNDQPFPSLSARERDILDLLAAGLSNAAIGARLGLAAKTVANNVSSIFAKLQVADRSEAIVRARDAGMGLG